MERNLDFCADAFASFQNTRLRRKLAGHKLAVFRHKIRNISRSYGNFEKWFLNSGRPSRDTPAKPFSHPLPGGGRCTPFPPKFYGLPYSEKLHKFLKTDCTFLSSALITPRDSFLEA
ncbi:hypothetical protein TNCV_3611461 [Trichonephila clavipes]|nr:hypothetical protein TNCV_3611461 [Trichonephila clavipes]